MTLYTIASGSEGNCLLVCCGGTKVLIDAGISLKRIKAALSQLELTMDDIHAILLTHAHTDHTAALGTLCKYHTTPLYTSVGAAAQICDKFGAAQQQMHIVRANEAFFIGALTITPFPTSHDAWGSIDYRLDGEGSSVGILTDTGYVTDEAFETLMGVNLLVLESNYDVEWLRSGPYPYHLKERILGDRGHLSNDNAARFAAEMARRGTKEIVLAHLSRENNTPERARSTVQRALDAADQAVRLSVAPRCELCRYEVETSLCRK